MSVLQHMKWICFLQRCEQKSSDKSCHSLKLGQRTSWSSCLCLSRVLCSVTQQFSDSDPTGAGGDPCCREEKGLLQSLLLHHRHWPSLGRTGGVGNTAGKGESKSSNLEDRATASNLKYFGAILEAVFCPSKQHYRRKKSQQKDEYHLLDYSCVECNEESGFPCLPARHPVGCSSL